MHATVADEPEQVHCLPVGEDAVNRCVEDRVYPEFAGGDGTVQPGQPLVHHESGPEIRVANLGVAHLSGRQTHILA
jgi:hypothetical protein